MQDRKARTEQVKKLGKPVILIPAYNEGLNIGHTLAEIKKAKCNADILVIDDGSTDWTKSLLEGLEIKVISFPTNRGKTAAVFRGLKEAAATNPIAVVLMDADMVHIPERGLKELIAKAAQATVQKKAVMCRAPQVEYGVPTHLAYSGIRSLSLPALHRIRASRIKRIPEGYGLELFFNKLFQGKIVEVNIPFETHIMYRGQGNRQRMDLELTHARLKRLERKLAGGNLGKRPQRRL